MKKSLVWMSLVFLPWLSASANECDAAKLSRDAIRAIGLVSNRSMMTDLVGGCSDSTCDIWANYRAYDYSDHYEVVTDSGACRVLSLRLMAAHQPIQNGN